ncbi:armadillo repeat-containing protein 6-like [Saccostrea cucullata]|uniref:armadillo repeat-containing protein 6-like n=1 Tax=Saccostrea cuccullata TaxID=36930 RepID=UPI002ED31D3B
MAKVITQETFDDVVKENMTEFEMSADEAVKDAVEQFLSQGVNLMNIIQDPTLYGADGEKKELPVMSVLNNLSTSLTQNNEEEIISDLVKLKLECDKDIAVRCIAGKDGAYDVLIKTLENYKNNVNLLKQTLISLISLTNGQPDLLDNKGKELFLELLEMYSSNPEILEPVLLFVRNSCIKHEENRQSYVKLGLIEKLASTLKTQRSHPTIVMATCQVLQVLTFDDDIRVPFGQAHEHAKMIVTEGNALKIIIDLCKEFTDKPEVMSELFATVSKLVVRDEFCQAVMDMGGIDLILSAFQASIANKEIAKQALSVTKALAGNDKVKETVVQNGGVEVILGAMMKHQANQKIAELGTATIAALVLRNPSNCKRVMELNGHQVTLQAMKIHSQDANVQKQSCMAIRNLVSRTREYCDSFLELGAESLIQEAQRNHKSCQDEAKAALRDLGCEVHLEERWKGEKQGLAK